MHCDLTFSDVFAPGVFEHVERCRTLEMLLHDGIPPCIVWWTGGMRIVMSRPLVARK